MYRCSKCRHGRNLTAAAEATVFGPLDTDGQLARYDDIEDTGLIWESSVQCSVHVNFVLEKKVGGRFGRWQNCAACKGSGREKSQRYGHYAERACSTCHGAGGAWVIVRPQPTQALACQGGIS